MQLNLFEEPKPKPLPEMTDPQRLFVTTLQSLGGIRTASEIAASAYPIMDIEKASNVMAKRETLRKRAKELVRLGVVCEADRRLCRVTGKEATGYEVMR